jgi:hypothetical protein
MKSSAAEIDLKLREDFRRYLREYGIESTVIDPVLAVLFRTFASQIYSISSDTDRLRTALLDELIEGLNFERRHARPAQAIIQYSCSGRPINVAAGAELSGEAENGGRMTFATDYGITVSSARVACVFVYQDQSLRLLSGMELPADVLRAGPSYAPASVNLGPNPAIYIAIDNVDSIHLSRHGVFLQISPEAVLLRAQLSEENWCLASNEGAFAIQGLLRTRDLNAGQHALEWVAPAYRDDQPGDDVDRPKLPGGFWHSRCFLFPEVPKDRCFCCEMPRGLEAAVKAFERPALFKQPRAWIRIQLSPNVEPLHSALSAVHLHAQSASNVECFNQTVRFKDHGATIPVTRESGAPLFLVAPLSVTGESGATYVPEFQPSFVSEVGRFRMHQGYLTMLPGRMSNGALETYANVRLWMTLGSVGNQMGATRLASFVKAPPAAHIRVASITSAAGGADGESFSSARQRFAETLLSRERLITRADLSTAIRAFDRRIAHIEILPQVARSATGLRRMHKVALKASRSEFVAPDDEARVLLSDLDTYLRERVPLDVDLAVELTWS